MASLSTSSPPAAGHAPAFRAADPEDAPGILRLLRETPFGDRVSLTLETDPAHHPALAVDRRSHTVVAARPAAPRTILGLADRSVYPLWLDGRVVRIGYLGQLRRKPGEEITLRRLRTGYRMLEEHRLRDEEAFDFTSILSGNTPARRLLERGLPGLPRYEAVGRMVTLTVATTRAARLSDGGARPLQSEDREAALARLRRCHAARQLAPEVDAAVFELPGTHWFAAFRGGDLAGCLALWDQRSFKSLAIHAYSPWLRRLRLPLNSLRRLTGSPPLPAVGSRLPLAFLSFLAAERDDPALVMSLVGAAAAAVQCESLPVLNLGLPADHPAIAPLCKALRPETTPSVIYLVHPASSPDGNTSSLSFDLPVHPEIALL